MCGIAGVVAWDEKYRVTRAQLQRMSDALAHRGPDGEGHFLNVDDREITPNNPHCGFAFRRLAIIDPDPRSNQPFTIGNLTLVFNGEIYNYRELKSEISKIRPDYAWRTAGDTEVLLMSYAVWGKECVDRLTGMFAVAVWDDEGKELFLARDRMGQKPLYVLGQRSAFAFASELGALYTLPWARDGLRREADALATYLRYGYTASDHWLPALQMASPGGFHVIRRHVLASPALAKWFDEIDDDGYSYWHLGGGEPLPDEAAVDATRRLLTQSVARQLVSDVPLGVLLSGGIDSSVVAACARQAGEVQTFTARFDDPRYDESTPAREVARHLGTAHHEFTVTPDVVADLPRLVAAFGEPFADSSMLPTYYLARETRRHVKVALGGDGGDELFAGYDRYRAMGLASRLKPGFAGSLVAMVARPWGTGHPKSRMTRAARFFASLRLDDAKRYDAYMRVFDDRTIRALMNKDPGRCPGVEELFRLEMRRTGDPVRAALATDRITYLPDDLLTKLDRASMLHNLEVRSPFMDHELVRFAAGLTTDQLLKGGPKRMLREAFAKDLPDFVFKRPKMGFAVPIGEWFRGPLRAMLRDNLFAGDSFGKQHFNMKVVERLVDEHERERVDHSQRLYALLMLELWWHWHRSAG